MVLPQSPTSPNLHLQAGSWVGSCPTCGLELSHDDDQEQAELAASSAPCPICHGQC
jgi:hypothetical protein